MVLSIDVLWSLSLCLFVCHDPKQYDVINHGKDGIGAVSSSGQGSLWRLEALKGQRPDGSCTEDPKNLVLVGKKLGFRSEMLIEDTHTSIELFRQVGKAWSTADSWSHRIYGVEPGGGEAEEGDAQLLFLIVADWFLMGVHALSNRRRYMFRETCISLRNPGHGQDICTQTTTRWRKTVGPLYITITSPMSRQFKKVFTRKYLHESVLPETSQISPNPHEFVSYEIVPNCWFHADCCILNLKFIF